MTDGEGGNPGPPFRKVLIANRGEIAVRIIQTCREMGILTAAVYSEADADALHVLQADEAYCVGPPPALESYLNIGTVLKAARASGVDAIHPGYGFLAESPAFARAVQDAGVVWIGPPPDVIALMGDKVACKQLAERAGVPVVPGYDGADQSSQRMLAEAERIGYPVMLKAAAGGGGRGMRAVTDSEGLPAALEGAKREARSAFGDDRVFLEKLLTRPRHVEIQVFADAHGNAIHLGERDCSTQRRHQKVVEESPSPVITTELRHAMGNAAVRLALSGGYRNAGTVEFLFADDSYYFLEMNTRIQVEHPVTEMVAGLDLIALQIQVAAGYPLPLSQLDVQLRGHAIEARIYAEDAEAGFVPATGTLEVFRPPLGPGLRNDVGVFEGASVSQYYDPLLAKVVVHAETRSAAVSRLQEAIERYGALGVTTNVGFLHWITEGKEFREGRVDTGFVDRNWPPKKDLELPPEVLMAAAAFEVAQAPVASRDRPFNPWTDGGTWRATGATRTLFYAFAGRDNAVQATRTKGTSWIFRIGDEVHEIDVQPGGPGVLLLRRQAAVMTFFIARSPVGIAVTWRGTAFLLRRTGRLLAARAGQKSTGSAGLTAPMPGTVVKVAAKKGQQVRAREALVVLEAMKMEHVIEAPHSGIVREILFHEGEMVPAGAPVVRLEEE